MQLATLDIIALIAYLSLMAGIGIYFARRNTNTEEYFVGGRSIAGWVIGLSLVGTSISSITFLAYPADAYKTAWLRYLPNLMLPLAVIVAAYIFLPFFRRGQTMTAYEYLEDRFGPSIRVYGAVAFIVAQLVRISLILYLVSLLVQEITGLDAMTSIVIGGLFVGGYTIIGGIDAVIWTDVIQTIVLVLGGLLALWIIVDQLPGGLGQIFEVAGRDGKLAFSEWVDGEPRVIDWGLSLSTKTGTMMLLFGLTIWLTEYSANQNTVQRFCAASSDAEARRAMFICAGTSLPIWAFYMFLGTSLYVFFQAFPVTEAAEMLDGTRKAEQIFPYFINHYLPEGLAGMVIAAALAAAMSSLDSSINAISAVSIVDIYKRHVRPGRDDRHYLNAARLVTAVTSLFMIMGAWYLVEAETRTLQDMATILASILGGGLLSMYLIGFLTDRGDARSVWAGIIATMLFTTWTILSRNGFLPDAVSVPFDLYYTAIIGNVVMFIVVYILAHLFHTHRDLRGLTIWERG
jgi:SSS family solute:Na+ symporter